MSHMRITFERFVKIVLANTLNLTVHHWFNWFISLCMRWNKCQNGSCWYRSVNTLHKVLLHMFQKPQAAKPPYWTERMVGLQWIDGSYHDRKRSRRWSTYLTLMSSVLKATGKPMQLIIKLINPSEVLS